VFTYGNKTRGFDHFNLSFIEIGSNLIVNSLAKCLNDLKEPMVDRYGDLLYKKGISNHPLHEALLQTESYENVFSTKMMIGKNLR